MRAEKPASNFRRLLRFVFRYRGKLIVGIIFSFLVAIFHAVSLGSLIPFFETLFRTEESRAALQLPKWLNFLGGIQDYLAADRQRGLLLIAGFLLVVFFIKGVCRFVAGYLIGGVAARTARDISNQLYDKMMDLSMDFFSQTDSSAGMTRFTNDLAAASSGVKTVFGRMLGEPLQFLATIAVLVVLDPGLTLISLAVFPVIAVVLYAVGKRVRKAAVRMLARREKLLGILKESFLGMRIIKAFQMEDTQKERFFKDNQRLFKQEMRIVGAEAMMSPLMEFLAIAGACLVIVVGGYFVLIGRMEPTIFLTFYIALATLFGPPRKLANVNNRIQMMMAGCARIFEFMDLKPRVREVEGARELAPLTHSLAFEHVSFSYHEERAVLKDISLQVRPGEKLAIVGLSGAGKSTLISLIPRFYDPTGGRVSFDGKDIASATLASVRRQVGLVTQENILFNDTIYNNIAFGRKDATRDEVLAAAAKAHVEEFASRLPRGYETVIGEQGVSLSGGQRQRLALARAIVKDPAILILDEATSSLDSESESFIQQALEDFMKSRASIIIAHRLATVEGADSILVLKDGQVVAAGSHEHLIRDCPFYIRLYQNQFRLMEEAET